MAWVLSRLFFRHTSLALLVCLYPSALSGWSKSDAPREFLSERARGMEGGRQGVRETDRERERARASWGWSKSDDLRPMPRKCHLNILDYTFFLLILPFFSFLYVLVFSFFPPLFSIFFYFFLLFLFPFSFWRLNTRCASGDNICSPYLSPLFLISFSLSVLSPFLPQGIEHRWRTRVDKKNTQRSKAERCVCVCVSVCVLVCVR